MSDPAQLLVDHLDIWTSAIERKSGSGRGNGGKINLYGIDKLRSLILDLAVRGKLVPQDPADGDAGEMLKRVYRERKQLIASRKLSKPKAIRSEESKLAALEVPRSWARDFFGNVFSLEYGDNLPERARSESGEYPVYGSNGVVGSHSEYCVDAPCIVVGRKGSAGAVNRCDEQACWVTDVAFYCVPPSGFDLRFVEVLFVALKLDDLGKGIKPGLNRNEANALPIALPPLAEQKRIVAKVDELMALVDALEAGTRAGMEAHETLVRELLATLVNSQDLGDLAQNWSRIDAHFDTLFTTEDSIDALKQTVLELAVRGKLVRHRNTSTGSQLLDELKKNRAKLVREGKAKKHAQLPPVDQRLVPFEIPAHWTWARFVEIGVFERGKSKHRPRNDPKLFNPGVYPLVQTGEVARAGDTIQESYSEYSEFGLAQSKLWPQGTLCITIAANIADSAILGFDSCFPDSVVGFVPAKPISNARYFLHFMKTAKSDLLKFAPATAQKNINLGILETVAVPLPPLEEMESIVSKVDGLFEMCEELKVRIGVTGEKSRALADAITIPSTA